MKKYLIKGLLALFAGSFAASCADHDVDYVPLGQQKTQAYEQAFKEMIGGDVDPNQNWGFTGTVFDEETVSSARAKTRVDECGWSVTSSFTETFTRAEMGLVLSALPEGVNAGSKLNDYEFKSNGSVEFCIVYSITSAADKVGYYYYDPNEAPNNYGGKNNPVYKEFVSNIQNTNHKNDNYYFQYGFYDGNWETPIITPWPLDGVTEDWGKKPWTCQELYNMGEAQDKVRAKKFTLNIKKGYIFGFYVVNGQHTMFSKKSRNSDNNFYSAVATLSDGRYAVGLEDWWYDANENPRSDFDCNDIVMTIKATEDKPDIVNYSQTVTTRSTQTKKHKILLAQGRVFCEDLGAAGQKDIDFNDIVFDARIWWSQTYDETTVLTNGVQSGMEYDMKPAKYEADICMLAAGGTIPAKLCNKWNIHDLFEGSPGQTTMINTVDSHAGELTTWDNMKAFPGAKTYNDVDITSFITALQAAEAPKKHTITVNDIPISVLWQTSDNPELAKLDWENNTMQTVGELHADPGLVPHKICLPIGTKWPSERQEFRLAYPDFVSWAQLETDDNKTFYNNRKDDYIYHDEGWDASLTMTDPYGVAFANNDTDYNKEYYIPIGDPTITQTKETTEFTLQATDVILWQGSQAMGDWKEQAVGVYGNWADMAGGKVIIIGTVDEGKTAKMRARDAWWGRCFVGDSQTVPVFTGYKEFSLQADDNIRFGKDGDQLYIDGQYFTLNYVIYRP